MGMQSTRKRWLLVSVLGALLVVGGAAAAVEIASTPTPPMSLTVRSAATAAATEAGQCPPAKLQACAAEQAQREHAQARVPATPKVPTLPTPSGSAGPTYFAHGITQTAQSPVPHLPFVQSNLWSGRVGGTEVSVGAGSVAQDPENPAPSSVGELVVFPVPGTASQAKQVLYSAIPGPFKITQALGDELTVAGSDGQQFHYDVSAATIS